MEAIIEFLLVTAVKVMRAANGTAAAEFIWRLNYLSGGL
jgi:hypothetical protein